MELIRNRFTGEVLCEGRSLANVVADHKLWLESGGTKGREANLRGAYLRGADLQGADLLEFKDCKGKDDSN